MPADNGIATIRLAKLGDLTNGLKELVLHSYLALLEYKPAHIESFLRDKVIDSPTW